MLIAAVQGATATSCSITDQQGNALLSAFLPWSILANNVLELLSLCHQNLENIHFQI